MYLVETVEISNLYVTKFGYAFYTYKIIRSFRRGRLDDDYMGIINEIDNNVIGVYSDVFA